MFLMEILNSSIDETVESSTFSKFTSSKYSYTPNTLKQTLYSRLPTTSKISFRYSRFLFSYVIEQTVNFIRGNQYLLFILSEICLMEVNINQLSLNSFHKGQDSTRFFKKSKV